jgi:hypothetical protein
MKIILPQALAADAIVPQSLDNQFITDEVLDTMIDRAKPFGDPEIDRLRLEDSHSEFIRSLLYGSSVVVNRAYFVNPGYVRQQLTQEKSAIPALMQKKAIVPYLLTERSLTDEADFRHDPDGLAALRRLEAAGALDGVVCVRFSEDDQRNRETVETLGSMFRKFARDLESLPDETQFTRIAAGLYYANEFGKHPEDMAVPDEVIREFSDLLGKCSRFMVDKLEVLRAEKKRFGRQHLYEHFFIQDGEAFPDKVQRGHFTPGLKQPGLRMLKKLVDLNYNCNLPDLLGRYTLTPAKLPGRSLLPYAAPAEPVDGGDLYKQLAGIKSSIMDQKPALLPRLRDMDLHHVLEIRELPEWRKFQDSQTEMLQARADGLSLRVADYYDGLGKFQDRLSLWSIEHAPGAVKRGKLFKTIASVVVQVGVVSIVLAIAPEGTAHSVGAIGLAAAAGLEVGKDRLKKFLEENYVTGWIEGMSVKLMVKAFDNMSNVLDSDHSYQLELIRHEKRLRVNEVIELVQDVQGSAAVVSTTGQLAEQS